MSLHSIIDSKSLGFVRQLHKKTWIELIVWWVELTEDSVFKWNNVKMIQKTMNLSIEWKGKWYQLKNERK